jgi:flagellar hook-associated protein 1 FlgK
VSGLFGSLTSAARSLDAQRFGLDVVGQNIANVNTAGYSRRTVDFAAIPPTTRLNAGGGVEVLGVRAIRDSLLDRRLWQELPHERMQTAIADSLSLVEVALGDAGQSIDQKLTAFFDSFARLSEDPTSATARQEVLLQGQGAASAFGDMVDRLSLAQRDADTGIRGAVDQVNALVTQISGLNASIASAGGSGADVQVLKDRQLEAVKTLSGLLNVDVLARQDGGVDITFGLGRPLVIGESAFSITATPTGPLGMVTLTDANGVAVAGEISTGRLGGLLQVRDATIPGYIARLDEIAYTFVQQVNTVHQAGFDLTGTAGLPFFAPLGSTSGAAAAMAVNGAVAADPNLVVAAGVAAAGDNQAARQIADLRDSRVMFGNTATLHDAWGRLVYQAGSDTQVARLEQRSRGEIVLQVEALRDSVAGVSLDEEAANMIRFQRAYEANARFFTTVDSAIETLINMVGR